MNKKSIEKMYNEMVESCEVKKSLYNKGLENEEFKIFKDMKEAQQRIDEISQTYMNTLNGLLLFGIITEKLQSYGYELLKEYDTII